MSDPLAPTDDLQPAWQHQLAKTYFVNSVAISADGSRIVAGTFYHNYAALAPAARFGVFCFDRTGKQLWSHLHPMFEGVYWVAISQNGQVAAGGGWAQSGQGFLCAYDSATGKKLLDFAGATERVSGISLAADGSSLLAYAGTTIYLFTNENGAFGETPSTVQTSGGIESIALSPAGDWLAACDSAGTIYFATITDGAIGTVGKWNSGSAVHSVASAASAPYFVAGDDAGNVHLFKANASPFAPIATANAGGSIRWVAATADAKRITAVSNVNESGTITGFDFDGNTLQQLWQAPLDHNPNSTSLDAAGRFATAADGYNGPGKFYLFDGETGAARGSYNTPQMNWPMFLSSDGSGIAAGSDDGTLYFFDPDAGASSRMRE